MRMRLAARGLLCFLSTCNMLQAGAESGQRRGPPATRGPGAAGARHAWPRVLQPPWRGPGLQTRVLQRQRGRDPRRGGGSAPRRPGQGVLRGVQAETQTPPPRHCQDPAVTISHSQPCINFCRSQFAVAKRHSYLCTNDCVKYEMCVNQLICD